MQQDGDSKRLIKTLYMAKKPFRTVRKLRPPRQLDPESLTPYSDGAKVSIDLYHRPKQIVQTNPRKVLERTYDKPKDEQRFIVQKTRARVVMPHAVAMDKIEEPLRQVFTDYFYKKTVQAMNDAMPHPKSRSKAPLSAVYAPTNPLIIEPLLEPYISPEWRLDAASPWKTRQTKTGRNPDKMLRPTRTPNCSASKTSAHKQAKKRRR